MTDTETKPITETPATTTEPAQPPESAALATTETADEPPDTRLPHEKDPEHVYKSEEWPAGHVETADEDGNVTREPILYRKEDGTLEPHPWQTTTRPWRP